MRAIHTLFILAVVLISTACKHSPNQNRETLAEGFVTPPASIQTSVYWYWISDNVSVSSVEKELEAMKRAGINRAFIGNIGQSDVPYGKVKMLSPEWWEVLHAALKKATELGIEIGIFNSPGWSQSGGPWVQSTEAMRYLASSQVRVSGPNQIDIALPKPNDLFQDVRVIAYPVPKEDDLRLNTSNSQLSSLPAIAHLENLFDTDTLTTTVLGKTAQIDWKTDTPFTVRSLTLRPTATPFSGQAELLYLESATPGKAATWQTLSTFPVDRKTLLLSVGFVPDAPIVVSLPATASTHFRLIIRSNQPEITLREVELAAAPRVERYSEKTLAKMFPEPLPYWKEYQWPRQPVIDDTTRIIKPSQVVDISQYMSTDGTLRWKAPAGEWIIMRMGMTPTGTVNSPASPEATGYEVDKMSKIHAEKHFHGHIGEILERIPAADRKSFKVVVQDSYETGGQNFTDGFLELFEARYGYDPLPYLPVYEGKVVSSAEASDRFLWDMRRLVADKVAYDYVAGLREVSHQYGLTTWLENYGHWGFPGEFLQYGGQSDEIGGEFWAEGDLGNIENRAAISCGHIYGKTKISAESFTSFGQPYQRHPATFKARGDRFFAEGINNSLLHVFISQPYDSLPGINAWFGTEFSPNNTWFSHIDLFTTYLKRVNFMLQQGLNVADVAYFIGEDTPKMTGITDPALPAGYQFDYMNAEVILTKMEVRDGLLTLPHGTQYRLLVLPQLTTMRPELLAKIQQLVMDGAVVLGPPPTRSPSLQNQPIADAQVSEMASQLWGDVDGVKKTSARRGKGYIFRNQSIEEVFAFLKVVPDCALSTDKVHYGHRTLPKGIELYFLSNQTDQPQNVQAEFRVSGRKPELWLPATGEMRDLPAYQQDHTTTQVPITLQANESAFVVFAKVSKEPLNTLSTATNFPLPRPINHLAGPWSVTFDSTMRGPAKPVQFDRLQDWSTSDNDSIKYYAGVAKYAMSFMMDSVPANHRIVLDLGEVNMMARVAIDGKNVGGVWTAPYQVDITPYIQKGENQLTIEVVNTWPNRLIGDSKLPVKERKTWSVHSPWTPETPLEKAGLVGPVLILAYPHGLASPNL